MTCPRIQLALSITLTNYEIHTWARDRKWIENLTNSDIVSNESRQDLAAQVGLGNVDKSVILDIGPSADTDAVSISCTMSRSKSVFVYQKKDYLIEMVKVVSYLSRRIHTKWTKLVPHGHDQWEKR